MKSAVKIIILTIAICHLPACMRNAESNLIAEAGELYEKTLALTNSYTDSVLNSKDSAQLHRLTDKFETELTKLNFQYPPDTDYEMNEGQNDTLLQISKRYVEARDSMLYYFAHHRVEPDSVAADSTMVIIDS